MSAATSSRRRSHPAGAPEAPADAAPRVIMRARGLELAFGTTRALRGIDLDVVAGEVNVVVHLLSPPSEVFWPVGNPGSFRAAAHAPNGDRLE